MTSSNNNNLTVLQKLKWMILARVAEWEKMPAPTNLTGDDIDDLYEDLVDSDGHWDAMSELRVGQFETGLPCFSSRHYETKSVAAQAPDGSWVGWTYWYGGGKHGEPEAVPWMDEAYELNCTEEQKMVTVRTFERKE